MSSHTKISWPLDFVQEGRGANAVQANAKWSGTNRPMKPPFFKTHFAHPSIPTPSTPITTVPSPPPAAYEDSRAPAPLLQNPPFPHLPLNFFAHTTSTHTTSAPTPSTPLTRAPSQTPAARDGSSASAPFLQQPPRLPLLPPSTPPPPHLPHHSPRPQPNRQRSVMAVVHQRPSPPKHPFCRSYPDTTYHPHTFHTTHQGPIPTARGVWWQ